MIFFFIIQLFWLIIWKSGGESTPLAPLYGGHGCTCRASAIAVHEIGKTRSKDGLDPSRSSSTPVIRNVRGEVFHGASSSFSGNYLERVYDNETSIYQQRSRTIESWRCTLSQWFINHTVLQKKKIKIIHH